MGFGTNCRLGLNEKIIKIQRKKMGVEAKCRLGLL